MSRYTSNAPYSGGKATAAAGGFRVPAIAWWPGMIEAASSTDLMASTMDLLPTFASLAGESFVSPVPIDGLDLSVLFGSQLPTTSPRSSFAYYGYFKAENQYCETDQVLLHAVREGRWKYYLKPTQFLGVGTEEYLEIPEGALYDLDADPGETNNVADRHPGVVAEMQALAQSFVLELGDDGQIGSGVRKAGYVKEGRPMNDSR
jgi:arylsulfatase A-like enzyme